MNRVLQHAPNQGAAAETDQVSLQVLRADDVDSCSSRMVEPGTAPKTVLMLSYVFPPAAYVGGHRVARYCKYLPQYGWRPVVVTINCRRVVLQDQDLCKHLPENLPIYRTPDIDPAKWLNSLSSLRHRLRPSRLRALPATQPSQLFSSPKSRRWTPRLRQFVERALLQSPDSHVFWVPFAFLWGARVLLTQRVDVIYSSSPPHSCHLAAYLLAKCFRRPYVLDFRDPWDVPLKRTRRACRFQVALKRTVVANAAGIVAVSPGERNDLIQEFPHLDSRRFTSITNGYDPDDFTNLEICGHEPCRFQLTHTGTIYSKAGSEFFEAMRLLVKRHPDLSHILRVNLIGSVPTEYEDSVKFLSREGILGDFGFKPHKTALQHALKSDALVILLGGDRFPPAELPAKVFEYLYCGKPILAVSKEGDLSRLLARSGTGTLVPPNDPVQLADAIWGLVTTWRLGRLRVIPDWDFVTMFNRRFLAGQLSSVLDAVSLQHPGSGRGPCRSAG